MNYKMIFIFPILLALLSCDGNNLESVKNDEIKEDEVEVISADVETEELEEQTNSKRLVAYQGGENNNELWTMEMDGSNSQKIYDEIFNFVWSPDGHLIYFGVVAEDNRNLDLYSANVQDNYKITKITTLTNRAEEEPYEAGYFWSDMFIAQNGNLCINCNFEGAFDQEKRQLVSYNFETKEETFYKSYSARTDEVAVYIDPIRRKNMKKFKLEDSKIYYQTGEAEQLLVEIDPELAVTENNLHLYPSPDGSKLIYYIEIDPAYGKCFVVNMDGTEHKLLADSPYTLLAWDEDGHSFYSAHIEYGFYRYTGKKHEPVMITEERLGYQVQPRVE